VKFATEANFGVTACVLVVEEVDVACGAQNSRPHPTRASQDAASAISASRRFPLVMDP
jgi:hypothetical protein